MPDQPVALKSCLYTGTVWHRRFSPEHEFRYRLFLAYLDLSELDTVFRDRWLWSAHRPALARFRRDDHLGNADRPLDECVRELVDAQTGIQTDGPIRLLTQLRCFGYFMNPISLYYCFDAADRSIQAVVAEVNNTPWGERHCYVIPGLPSASSGETQACQDKLFHVSPFLPMDMQYRWQLSVPGKFLSVEIENHRQGSPAMAAALSLRRQSFSPVGSTVTLLRHPFMTGKIAAAIYWQAFRLWSKGAKFYPHPQAPSGSHSGGSSSTTREPALTIPPDSFPRGSEKQL